MAKNDTQGKRGDVGGSVVQSPSFLRRNRTLFLSVLLFLLFVFVILGLNYLNTIRSGMATAQSELTARLSTLSQTIAKTVYDANLSAQEITRRKQLASLDNYAAPGAAPAASAQAPQERADGQEPAAANEPAADQAQAAPKASRPIPLSVVVDSWENAVSAPDQGKAASAVAQPAAKLEDMSGRFEKYLSLVEKGGQYVTEQGEKVYVKPIADPVGVRDAKYLRDLWDPYKNLIDLFAQSARDKNINVRSIGYASDYAKIFDRYIYNQTDLIGSVFQRRVADLNAQSRFLQTFATIVSLVFFLSFSFFIVRRLALSDRKLQQSINETNNIMRTVHEGLCLIDNDLTIGSSYSATLPELFGERNLAGRKLTDLLEPMLTQQSQLELRTFVKQLFNPRTVEELIYELNPLQNVEMTILDEGGRKRQRYLSFSFNRVRSGQGIESALVSVRDQTETVLLDKRLEEEKQQSEEQMELFSRVMQVDRPLLKSFISSVNTKLLRINDILKDQSRSQSEMRDKLAAIYREVHGLKGESSALKLKKYVTLCESFEDKIKTLQNKEESLTGSDFLTLTMSLEELMNLQAIVNVVGGQDSILEMKDGVIRRKDETGSAEDALRSGQSESGGSRIDETVFNKFYADFVQDIAKRQGKKARLIVQGLGKPLLSQLQQEKIKEIITQLLRNSVVHGIETPNARKEANKPETGEIYLLMNVDGKSRRAKLVCHDNGAGLNPDKIKQKLREKGKSAAEIEAMSEAEVYKSIFTPGLSTKDDPTEDAGKGVGMDVVKERVQQLGGQMKFQTRLGEFTRFIVEFPLLF